MTDSIVCLIAAGGDVGTWGRGDVGTPSPNEQQQQSCGTGHAATLLTSLRLRIVDIALETSFPQNDPQTWGSFWGSKGSKEHLM